MQSAIGRIQLQRMNDWHKKRTDNALAIAKACEPFSANGLLRVPVPPSDIEHAFYKFYIFVEPAMLKPNWTRDRIIDEVNQRGVPCFQGACPEVYLEKAFENTGFRPVKRLPVAKKLGETSLMFLVHPTLTTQEIGQTGSILNEVVNKAACC